MDKNFSDTSVDRRMLYKCVQFGLFPSCNSPHGKEFHSSHFHFCKLPLLQMDLRPGRTDIHTHQKLSISFLPERTPSVSSPYTWEQCLGSPSPQFIPLWTANCENHSRCSEQQLSPKPHVHHPSEWSANYS